MPQVLRSRHRLALFAVPALLLPLVRAPEVQAQNLKTFAPKNGGFSVQMPGKPKSTRKTTKSSDGSPIIDQEYVAESDTMLLQIGYQDFGTPLPQSAASELLDGAMTEGFAEMGAKSVKPKKISLSGFAGRDATAKISAGDETGMVRMRVFLAGRRVYMQMAVYADAASTNAAGKFMSSLRLLNPQPK